MHHKLSSWLASNYHDVLLPSFQTSEMARKYEKSISSDATPAREPVQRSRRKLSSPTVRSMMSLAHYKFKLLLKYKMERVGGWVIKCGEEYTSMTCSNCGERKCNLGGSNTYECDWCYLVCDRDVNAAKNIFHKNVKVLLGES